LANFKHSKFTEDLELYKRNGDQVYHQWVLNSFENPDKYFAISKNYNNKINGFLLFSLINNSIKVELISVDVKCKKSGIGSNLLKAVECMALEKKIKKIIVGTQILNIEAINFYHKNGFKQVGSHQVYHYWNYS
jgi:ribosomal protein S18 acetylase RimI-like enzyme